MSFTPYVPPSTLTALPSGIWAGTNGWPVLPYLPGQLMSVTKAPKWSTQVIRSASGRERRTPYWNYPLWQFELSYEVVRHRPTNDELAKMWEFFNLLQGQLGTFLFVDPTDCQIASSAPVTFGAGDGSIRTFAPLLRALNSYTEPVWAMYAPTILDNGSPSGGSPVVTGASVTFGTAPASAHTLSAYGYFYFGCRFLQDDMSFEGLIQTLWSGKSLKFTSQRV